MNLHLPILEAATANTGVALAAPVMPGDSELAPDQLVDSHGRVIRDLRLSITDRCNFRCTYCLDPGATFLHQSRLLSTDELVRVARICVALGVRKIRITGGEPTLRPDLLEIVERLHNLGLDDLAMTTNGSNLDRARLRELRRAGLRRITFSLDSLREDRFQAITRSGVGVAKVLEAVALSRDEGLRPVRVNAVIVRGVNDDEVVELAGLAHQMAIELRFIEFMPLDAARSWDRNQVVTAREILGKVTDAFQLVQSSDDRPDSTSMNYRFADGAPGGIGFIAPVSRPFCGACSRLRITADGRVRPCLFSHDEWNLFDLLRTKAADTEIVRLLATATWSKQSGHHIGERGFTPPARTMSAIGG